MEMRRMDLPASLPPSTRKTFPSLFALAQLLGLTDAEQLVLPRRPRPRSICQHIVLLKPRSVSWQRQPQEQQHNNLLLIIYCHSALACRLPPQGCQKGTSSLPLMGLEAGPQDPASREGLQPIYHSAEHHYLFKKLHQTGKLISFNRPRSAGQAVCRETLCSSKWQKGTADRRQGLDPEEQICFIRGDESCFQSRAALSKQSCHRLLWPEV